MSTRKALVAAVVLCGFLWVGFIAGMTAEKNVASPPFTLTPCSGGLSRTFLLTDSQSSTVKLVAFWEQYTGYETRPRVENNGMALIVLNEFDLTKLSSQGAPPSKP
jgi:hypothetical protein